MFLIEPFRQGQLISITTSSDGNVYNSGGLGGGASTLHTTSGSVGHQGAVPEPGSQGLAALLVMVAVLAFILAYCFWGAPWCRACCRRRVCPCLDSHASSSDLSSGCSSPAAAPLTGGYGAPSTPTIVLLPYGRMLVVDGSVIARFQASDAHGADLLELSQTMAGLRYGNVSGVPALSRSTPSILSSTDTGSKEGLSPIFPIRGFSPPTYESLFGNTGLNRDNNSTELPPSYSEISFQLRQLNNAITREFGDLTVERRSAVIRLSPPYGSYELIQERDRNVQLTTEARSASEGDVLAESRL